MYERVTRGHAANGQITWRTNRFTLVENALHYLENGEWKASRDVIEPFPQGAIARYGPHQAIFSPDLNAPAVFAIQMAEGGRLRGGARAIQLTDSKHDRSVVLATVKASAPGELLPPDRIVYRDAFAGLKADLVLVWRHNVFSQDVGLRERPELPAGWDPATTRLEILTEFIECPAPEVRRQWVERPEGTRLEDDVVLDFGAMAMLMGHGFAVAGAPEAGRGGLPPAPGATPVLKQYRELPDGRRFLVESVAWADLVAQWENRPRTARVEPAFAPPDVPGARPAPSGPERGTPKAARLAAWRIWPERPAAAAVAQPMLLAQAPYEPAGYVVDFVIVSGGSPTTFASGETYYLKSSYYSGSTVTFQPGCTIKFKQNAYLLLYGSVYFPTTTPEAVFTSRNDDLFGEIIQGVAGEADSDGNPESHQAAKALWLYYLNSSVTVQHALIRWAQKGAQYDMNAGVYLTHTLRDSTFQHCATGVHANLQNATLMLSNVKECNVSTPISGYGIYGSMTTDCGIVNASRWSHSQGEPAIAARGQHVVVVAMNPEEKGAGVSSGRSLLKMLSSDGGATWTATRFADGSDAMYQAFSDPALAYDSFGNLFLTYLTHDTRYNPWNTAVLYLSTDNGATFQALSSYPLPSGNNVDLPRVTTGPGGTAAVSTVWLSVWQSTFVSVLGAAVSGLGSVSSTWTTATMPSSYNCKMSSIVVGPAGQVMVAYRLKDVANAPLRVAVDEDGLGTAQGFVARSSVPVQMGGPWLPANGGYPITAMPCLAWDRTSDVAYVVYPDITDPANYLNDSNIFVRYSNDHGITWSSAIWVNDDTTGHNSQFHPRLAVDQASGNVAVSWYDCRLDVSNIRPYFYAAVSRDHFASVPPSNFQLQPVPSDARNLTEGSSHFFDYTGLTYEGGCIYPAWADNSASTPDNPDGVTRLDILTSKIAY